MLTYLSVNQFINKPLFVYLEQWRLQIHFAQLQRYIFNGIGSTLNLQYICIYIIIMYIIICEFWLEINKVSIYRYRFFLSYINWFCMYICLDVYKRVHLVYLVLSFS